MPEIRVERPKPKWSAQINWTWRNERCVAVVHANYAADTATAYPDGAPGIEGYALPNNISVNSGNNSIRFTRSGAEQLRDALTAALEWDGK
jgi:hypothetical protein